MCGKKIRRKLVPQKKKSCGQAGFKKNSFAENFSPPPVISSGPSSGRQDYHHVFPSLCTVSVEILKIRPGTILTEHSVNKAGKAY